MTAACAIRAACAFVCALAALAPAPAQANWGEVLTDRLAAGPACLALTENDDDTMLTLKMDRGDLEDEMIVLLVGNLGWSIREGDDLGELALVNREGGIVGVPVASDHGFFLYLPIDDIQRFATGASQGFALVRDGNVLSRFPGEDLQATVHDLVACARAEFH